MINLIKNKLVLGILILGIILIAVFKEGFCKNSVNTNQISNTQTQNQSPKIIATEPSPLDETTLLPTQTISVTFNLPLENLPELRYSIEPAIDLSVELSDDKKTIKFTPKENFALGQGYSLHIKSETKFEGKRTLGPEEKVFHFTTISYKGV